MDTSFRQSSYIPTSGFQYIFKHLRLNRGLLIFSKKEQLFQNGETLAKKFSLENNMCSECGFFGSFKSSLVNAAFYTTLNMHVSQDLVGKEKKEGQVSSALAAALDTPLLKAYVYISVALTKSITQEDFLS